MSNLINSFAQIRFADGEVIRLFTEVGEIGVQYKDWQEQQFRLIFADVVGYEVFSIEGEELSHGTASLDDPFIERACLIAREDPQGLCCFALWSAWTNEVLMRIVARSYRVERDSSNLV